MPTIRLGKRALDARPDRVDMRDYPYRPPLVSLPEQWPPPAWIRKYLPDYAADDMVLNQGNEGACTGFGLAAVVNFLKWEAWKRAEIDRLSQATPSKPLPPPEQVSARMLYQNARLYDEWKGEDYEGSSCRGAMKGLLKHGVCSMKHWPYGTKKKPGLPQDGWEDDAAATPLGAYYRIATDWIVALQAAIKEVHAIYVSANVHDGWEQLKPTKSIDTAVIAPPESSERGGHAFTLVGYRADGFIVQNSWGAAWGFQGFAVLPYEDWLENGYDAWVLALGAPLKRVAPKIAQTPVSLPARAGQQQDTVPATAVERKSALPARWSENEVARHVLIVGPNGRPVRHLVEALDEADGVHKVVGGGIETARAKGFKHVVLYAHGGLNDREAGLARARNMGPWFEVNGIYPIFVVWQTGFFETAKNVIAGFAQELAGPEKPPATGGLLEILRDRLDRSFEWSARQLGVKAIWEDMKMRADLASLKEGATGLAARTMLANLKDTKLHVIGHSAGAILLGNFIAALARSEAKVASCELWAPACTVDFALKTFGAALKDGRLAAARTVIEVLSDANEKRHYTVPALYSKSLLYLVSRALEPDHKTPVLGMEMAMPDREDIAKALNVFDDKALTVLKRWSTAAKNVSYRTPVAVPAVPTRRINGHVETIDADHGSFDNSLDSFDRALANILGEKPPRPALDLTGF